MADSRTITINLKAVSDFNDVVNNAKQIQTALSKIKVPENLKGAFDKIFSDIEKHSTKAAETMANGFKTKGDISSFQKNINGINTAYDKLYQTITKIDGTKLGFGSYEGEIKSLSAQIEGLQTKMANFANTYSKAVKDATVPPSGSKSQAWGQFAEAFETKDIEAAEKALHKLNLAMSKASEGNKATYAQKIQVLTEALKALKGESPEAIKDAEELQKKLSLLGELQAKGIKETAEGIEDIASNTYDAARGTKQFGESAEKAAQQTQNINSEMDHFKQKIAYFFGAQNAVNLFKRALQSAFATVKDLDAVMTETAVVTKFDVGDMWDQLPEYTKRANELGVSIHSAYEAATIYYQQGLETNQVMEVSNQTLKMARIAGLDAAEATDRMTNALRGFNMEINEMNAERVADVYSKLAAMSASNVDEISTAMTKVASLASNANMEFETTAAFLAQMIETTRESAETAGTALKTVIARFSEVKSLYSKGELLGTDEEGEAIDVNKVSKALRSVGVDLNEYLTGMKGLDDVFIELASKWDGLDQIQQRYIATMAAGSRQQSRFIAMMQDYVRTQELVGAAETANGASQEQYQKTLESLETKLNRLKNAWDEFVMSIANSKFIKGAVDLLTGFITAINKLTSSLPGALNGVAKLGLAFGAFKVGKTVFNKGLGEAGKIFLGKTQEIGEKGSQNLVQSFKTGFSKYTGNLKNLQNAFKPIEGQALKSVGDIQQSITQQLTSRGVDKEAAKEISNLFDGTEEGARKATEASAQFGVSLQGVKEGIGSAEQVQQSFTKGLASMSSGMMTAGGLLIMLAGILDRVGANKTAVKVIMSIGVALTFVGAILPMLGKAFDALGIQIAKDGLIAQAGWGWIGIVIAAVVALIAVAAVLISSAETASERVDRLTNSAKEAANAADEAAQKYEDLKSALDDLKDREDSLDGLIVGTKAWKDAVLQVNKQVLELLQNYPKLAAFVSSNNGVLGIDYDAAEKVLDEYNQIAIEAQKASVYSNAIVSQAKTDLSKENLFGSNVFFKQGRTTEVEQNVDLLAKALAGDAESIEAIGLPKQLKAGTEEFNTRISEIASNMGMIVSATDDAVGALRSYGQELLSTGAEINALLPALVESKVANEDYADSVKNFLSSDFLSDELEDEAGRKYETLAQEEKDAYKEYFKDLYGTDFKKVKANGDVELSDDRTIKREDAMNQFTGAKAGDIVDPIVDEFVKKIGSSDDEVAKAIESFYKNGKGGNLTKDQINQLGGKEGLEDVLKQLNLSDEVYEQVFADLTEGIELSSQSIDSLKAKARDLNITMIGLDKMSGASLQKFFDNIEEVEQESGEKAGQIIKAQFNEITKTMSDDDVKKFGDALAMIKWNDIKSVEDLPEILEDLGIESEVAEEDLTKLQDSIIDFSNATTKANGEINANTVKSSGKVLSNIRSGEQDRVFSEEDYKALMALPGMAEQFEGQFTQDADGNYIYLGNSMVDLQSAVEANTIALIESTQAELEGRIAGANAFEEHLGRRGMEVSDIGDLNNNEAATLLQSFIERNRGNLDSYGIDKLGNETKVAELQPEDVDLILAALAQNLENRSTNEAQLNAINGATSMSGLSSDQVANMGATDTQVRQSVMSEAQDYGLDPDEVIATSAAYQELNENLKENQALSDRIALDNMRMNKSLEEISSNIDKWKTSLDPASKNTEEYNQAVLSVQQSIRGLTGVTKDVSRGFAASAKAMELLERAANGDLDAITELRKAAAEDIVMQMHLDPEAEGQVLTAIDDIMSSAEYNDLEIGVSLQDTAFYEALQGLLDAGAITTEQMNDILEGIGFEPTIEMETVTVDSINTTDQTAEVIGADGEKRTVHLTNDMEVGGTIQIPRIGNSKFKGAPAATVTPSNRGGGGKGGGGGGGGGKAEKPTYWENPYDELYNLTEKINEALRTREALERRYQKIAKLSVTTAGEMRKAFKDQISQLRYELELQKQLQEGRLKQLRNVGNEYYVDKEGNRRTFAELGVTKYARYDEKAGTIILDNAGLDAIERDPNRSEEGEAAEAYISLLEERSEAYEDIRDAIWDIEDEIEDLAQQAIDDYLNFEDRVIDAIVDERQKEIDAFGELSDAIEDATNKVLDGMQKQIEAQRQMRENEKTEEELADKEARLAYLSRDTSGANQMEIMQLQEELDDARQNYTDSLIDQAIQQMRDDADLAAEQRAEQQAVMEAQLEVEKENGEIAQHAADLILAIAAESGALGEDSELMKLLKNAEGFEGMSIFRQKEWLSDTFEEFNKAQSIQEAQEEKERQKQASAANVAATTPTVTGTNTNSVTSTPAPQSSTPQTTWDTIVAAYNKINQGAWGNGVEHRVQMGRQEGFSEQSVRKAQQLINYTYPTYLGGYGYSWDYAKRLLGYKTGGLADFTGPAWLDGTRSHPEMVLNAADTENLIALKDILSNMWGGRGSNASNLGGDNYYTFDIQAEIGDDYDVDQLAERLKYLIVQDSNYRNVNAINFMR